MHHDIYLFTAEACTVYYGLSEVTWDLTLGYLVLQRWFTLILEHQHDNLDTFFKTSLNCFIWTSLLLISFNISPTSDMNFKCQTLLEL